MSGTGRVLSAFGPTPGGVERYTDEDIIEVWLETGSTKETAIRLGASDRTIRRRLAILRDEQKLPKNPTPDIDRHDKITRLASAVPRRVEGGGRIKRLGVTLHGMAAVHKDREHFIETGLDSTRGEYVFDPKLADLEAFHPRESLIRAYVPPGFGNPDIERIFIVGDQQIGFWKIRDSADGKQFRLLPFHDENAIDVMMQALAAFEPDRVVIIGDFLDFPQLSRFQQEPGYRGTLQASIHEAEQFIGKIRGTVGALCKIDYLLGNHETRLTRAIVNNNEELYALTRPGERWPLYSIPSLLNFERYDVECSAEYPSGEVWLAKRNGNIPGLVCTHADPKKRELRADAIHGHLVLPGLETRQVFYEDGAVTYTRMCVSGCGDYSDTSDRMRLTRTNTPSGRARMAAVQSFGTVEIDRHTGMRHFGLHLIHHGRVYFRDHVLVSEVAHVDGEER